MHFRNLLFYWHFSGMEIFPSKEGSIFCITSEIFLIRVCCVTHHCSINAHKTGWQCSLKDLLCRVVERYLDVYCAFCWVLVDLCQSEGWVGWDLSGCELLSPMARKSFSKRDIYSNAQINIIRVWINLLNIFSQQWCSYDRLKDGKVLSHGCLLRD